MVRHGSASRDRSQSRGFLSICPPPSSPRSAPVPPHAPAADALGLELDETAAAAGGAGGAAREAGAAARDAGVAAAEGAEQAATGWRAVTAALAEHASKARDIGGDVGQALVGAFTSAENAVGDFVKTGKLDFRDLVGGDAVGEGDGRGVDHRRAVGSGRVRADVDDGVRARGTVGAKVYRLGGARGGRAGAEAVGGGAGGGSDVGYRAGGRELAGEGLVAIEGLRAGGPGELGELGRDIRQRESADGAGGDRRQVEDGSAGRIPVMRELERRVGEEGRGR